MYATEETAACSRTTLECPAPRSEVDEAQDADPCIAGVVESQHHAQLIAVGDSAQAIYGWRGAGDFLARVDAHHRLRLTQSWRFGAAVAEEANTWLGVVGTELRVVGNPNLDSTLGPLDQPDSVLCRSNGGTIQQLLDAHDKGVRVHLVGDGKEMLALAQAAERMQDGRAAAHPELVAFNTWQEVVDYAENDPGGSDLAVAVQMIERYGPSEVIRAINGTVPADRAELRVSTAHKSKGLEWDRVRIGSDFREPLDKVTGQPLPIPREDAMLAYVAVPRAKLVLDTGGLGWIHDHLAALANPGGWTVGREHTPAVEAIAESPRPSSSPSVLQRPRNTPRRRRCTWRTAALAVAGQPSLWHLPSPPSWTTPLLSISQGGGFTWVIRFSLPGNAVST
ncbi:UvrD-helicase domain-containing protein [Acidiferrimicrobium sp. IK]|uniref:UvrD-helicase domain-containing protein n=1 Tax=Acidiferrimicrobium sp. IK TaxID=2871700 RepID=UPI0021CB4C43|nr:UvrD-helicase domain-containing protein [Acidiferrimicrobium sp. IK]MCU4183855.1 UvrD-helicase domain-containing protein [Acidiferrimicrobium sp. IK]